MLLSICIPTLNRAAYIGETLDSILAQMSDEVEVVIVDGGSRDGTAEVVERRSRLCPRVRRHLTPHLEAGTPQASNIGYDRDCDYAFQIAQGRYCWILPDDDLVVPGGLARLLDYLKSDRVLVVANAEVRSHDLGRVLQPRRLGIERDETFAKGEADALVARAGAYLSYAGGVVVRRDWWLRRDRARYYGSGFVHMGALLQDPSDLDALLIADPLIRLRYGNAAWTARAFEIWMIQWPDLVWSFPLSDATKAAVTAREPWRRLRTLILFRACGSFGRPDLRRLRSHARAKGVPGPGIGAALLAWTPGWLVHALLFPLALLLAGLRSTMVVDLLHSPHNLFRWMRSGRGTAPGKN